MQQYWRWLPAFLMATASGGALADSLDVSINDKSLRAIYAFSPAAKRGLEFDIGHYFTENSASVTHAGLQVSGENWSQKGVFDIGLGGRFVYVSSKPGHDGALAFGGRVRFSPVQRVGIGGSLFYAPEVTSWMDGKRYLETNITVDYQILPQGYVYVGYRGITVDFKKKNDVKLDDRGHIGMKLVF